MASTIQLQNTANFVAPYIFSSPIAIGTPNEPLITICNIILQTILGPPFCWRWNRKLPAAFNLTGGTQDYVEAYGDYGFFEKGWITENGVVKEIEQYALTLAQDTVQGRPAARISDIYDDNAGNITFRFMPVPDALKTRTAQILYQKKPPLFASTPLTQTWSPIPDELGYLYNFGVLGLALAFKRDPRAEQFIQKFVGHLLGIQSGLSELQKNAFLGKWLTTMLEVQAMQGRTQQGLQGRGT